MQINSKDIQKRVKKLALAPKVKLQSLNSVPKNLLTNPENFVKLPHCVLEHILNTKDLTILEKLFYILADSLALINANNAEGQREIGLAMHQWDKMLSSIKSQVFIMQNTIQEKGYFKVRRSFDHTNRQNRNVITPTLPKEIFEKLCKTQNREGQNDAFQESENYRSYLDRTKQFIRISYDVLYFVISNNQLTDTAKIVWLHLYISAQKNYLAKSKHNSNTPDFSFVSTLKELSVKYQINYSFLTRILGQLENLGFLQRQQFFLKASKSQEARQDVSIWEFFVLLPQIEKIEYNNEFLSKTEHNALTKEISQTRFELLSKTEHYNFQQNTLLKKESKEKKESSKEKNFLNLNLEKLKKKTRVKNTTLKTHQKPKGKNKAVSNSTDLEPVIPQNSQIAEQMIKTWNEVFQYALSPIKAYDTKAINLQLIHIFTLFFGNDLARWKDYGEKVNSSKFCMGEKATKSDFKAMFSWLVKEETVAAILAGGYGVGDRPIDRENISQNNESRKEAIFKLAEQKVASVTKQSICEITQKAEFKKYVLDEVFLLDDDAFGIMYLSRKYSKWGLFQPENEEICNYAFNRFLKGRYFAYEQDLVKAKLELLISSKTQDKTDYEAMLELESIQSQIAAINVASNKALDSFVQIAA
jgi:hypothetical protein